MTCQPLIVFDILMLRCAMHTKNFIDLYMTSECRDNIAQCYAMTAYILSNTRLLDGSGPFALPGDRLDNVKRKIRRLYLCH